MLIYLQPKFIGIFLISCICGIPLSLPASTLTTMLTEQGISLTVIGLFALVGVPYSFKYAWAPIIDNINPNILGLGRRRSWMVICQILTILSIATIAFLDPKVQLLQIAIAAVCIAFFSVTHDIVFDALRIESLKPEEQAAGASTYVFGYRLGMLISSAGALYIAHFYSWEIAYFSMACIMSLGVIVTFLISEPKKAKINHKTTFSLEEWLVKAYVEPLSEFISRVQAWHVLLFVILFKLGDAYAGMMTNPFLLSLGFSKIEIANIVKGIGLIATLSGVFVGGIIASKYSMGKCLFAALILQIVSNLFFLIQIAAGHDTVVLTGVICIENFTGGIGTSIFMAYLASLCNVKFTATQYALLSSLASLSRSFISGSAGFVVDSIGWSNFFVLSAFLSVPALFLIKSHNKKRNKGSAKQNSKVQIS